jgi:hypothetical protein
MHALVVGFEYFEFKVCCMCVMCLLPNEICMHTCAVCVCCHSESQKKEYTEKKTIAENSINLFLLAQCDMSVAFVVSVVASKNQQTTKQERN